MSTLFTVLILGALMRPQGLDLANMTVQSGSDNIIGIATSSDRRWTVTADAKSASLWDDQGRQARKFKMLYGGKVGCADVSADGTMVAVGGTLGKTGTARIDIFRIKSVDPAPFCQIVFAASAAKVVQVFFSADGLTLFARTDAQDAMRWNLKQVDQKGYLRFDPERTHINIRPRAMAINANRTQLVLINDDKVATLDATPTSKLRYLAAVPPPDVQLAAASNEGNLVVATLNQVFSLPDLSSTEWKLLKSEGDSSKGEVPALAISANGDYVAYSRSTEDARLLSRVTGQSVPLPKVRAYRLAFNSTDIVTTLIAAEGDHASIWNLGSPVTHRHDLRRLSLPLSCAVLGAEGRILVAGVEAPRTEHARLWNLKTGTQTELPFSAERMALSPSGRFATAQILTGSAIWDLEAGRQVRKLEFEAGAGHTSFLSDELLAEGSKSTLRFRSLPSARLERTVKLDQGSQLIGLQKILGSLPLAAIYQASEVQGGAAYLERIDPAGIEFQDHIPLQIDKDTRLLSARLSRDGKVLMGVALGPSLEQPYLLVLWETDRGRSLGQFYIGTDVVAISRDASLFAIALPNGRVEVRLLSELSKQGHTAQVQAFTDRVSSISFADDQNGIEQMVVSSSDGTVSFWPAEMLRDQIKSDVLTSTTAGKQILTIAVLKNGGWTAVARNGDFDGSNFGDDPGLQWLIGDKVVDFQEARSGFFRPGLLKTALTHPASPIAVLPQMPAETEAWIVDGVFHARVTRDAPTTQAFLVVNGIRRKEIPFAELKQGYEIPLSDLAIENALRPVNSGDPDNEVWIVTSNSREGALHASLGQDEDSPALISRSNRCRTAAPATKSLPRRLFPIIIVGSNYSKAPSLTCPPTDGSAIQTLLKAAKASDFILQDVTFIGAPSGPSNLVCNKENILRAFDAVVGKHLTTEDAVFLYISGHGTEVSDGKSGSYAFVTESSDPDVPSSLLLWLDIQEHLIKPLGRKPGGTAQVVPITVLLDTCYSGLQVEKLAATQTAAIDDGLTLGAATGDRSITANSGRAAYEIPALKHGAMTYALLQTFVDMSSLDNRLDRVDLALHHALRNPSFKSLVGSLTGDRQSVCFHDNMRWNFNLGSVSYDQIAKVTSLDFPILLDPHALGLQTADQDDPSRLNDALANLLSRGSFEMSQSRDRQSKPSPATGNAGYYYLANSTKRHWGFSLYGQYSVTDNLCKVSSLTVQYSSYLDNKLIPIRRPIDVSNLSPMTADELAPKLISIYVAKALTMWQELKGTGGRQITPRIR